MREAVALDHSEPGGKAAVSLLLEVQNAHQELLDRLRELGEILDQPRPNLPQLTTTRLKLAHLRLSRGSLVFRISKCLAGKTSPSEAAILQQMRLAHQQMLAAASVHTNKWTLDAVEADWPTYRQTTREVARLWLEKAKAEQQLIYPLLKKHAQGAVCQAHHLRP